MLPPTRSGTVRHGKGRDLQGSKMRDQNHRTIQGEDGCEYSDRCLDCPLDPCVLDSLYGVRRARREAQHREMRRLRDDSMPVVKIADYLGVSKRSVQRGLKATKEKR